jgi:hypothetical protein
MDNCCNQIVFSAIYVQLYQIDIFPKRENNILSDISIPFFLINRRQRSIVLLVY